MTLPQPEDVVAIWFPDSDAPTPEAHIRLWGWRMRGGAHDQVIAQFSALTARAAAGDLDHWAETPQGRLALIVILDQFTRLVWAGTARAYSCDPQARDHCLEGLANGHFDALDNVWQKTAFRVPLEHCECPEHRANLGRAIAIAERLADEALDHLRKAYAMGVAQPASQRAAIARFGRHPHRNAVLSRPSTPKELEYITQGDFPHTTKIDVPPEPAA